MKMTPRKENKKKPRPNAKVQNKAIEKNSAPDLPVEIIEKIVRSNPEVFRTCRSVCRKWEGECSRLAGLARNRIPLSTISWNVPRKGRGQVLRRRRQILASPRIPQMFETARFNSFTSFILNRRLMDQAICQLTKLELEITKSFIQLSEENFARCGLQLYSLLTEAPSLTSFKMTVSPKRCCGLYRIRFFLKFFARVDAFQLSILRHADARHGKDQTALRSLTMNNHAFYMFEHVFLYLIPISPSLEEVTVFLSPHYPVRDSDRMQIEITGLYANLALLGNCMFEMDNDPELEYSTRFQHWREGFVYRLFPIKEGINPNVTFLSTREDFLVEDGRAKLQSLWEKAPTLRVADPSFFNDGRKF